MGKMTSDGLKKGSSIFLIFQRRNEQRQGRVHILLVPIDAKEFKDNIAATFSKIVKRLA